MMTCSAVQPGGLSGWVDREVVTDFVLVSKGKSRLQAFMKVTHVLGIATLASCERYYFYNCLNVFLNVGGVTTLSLANK